MKPAARFETVLGQVVVNKRKQLKLTQGKAATAMRLPPSSLSRLERGSASFTVGQLRRAASALGVEVSHLFLEAEAGATVLTKRGVQVLDEDPPEEERARWVWVAPREVEQVVATIKLGSIASRDFWSIKSSKKEEKLKVQLRRP